MVSGIILAGGRSERMGSPKALLPFGDEPLIRHIARTLAPLFTDIVVVAAPGQRLPPLPVMVVRDEVPHRGPVGGILYGLRAARGESAFVTSCDSAFLSPALIRYLTSAGAGYDAVVPRWGGRLQPLVAVYRRTLVPLLEDQLANDARRLVDLFDKVRVRYVEEPDLRRYDPEGASFFNMNSPGDYAEGLRRWRAGRGS